MKENLSKGHKRALELMLIPPRNLKELSLSTYLRDNSLYTSALVEEVIYSVLTPPIDRYYFNWLRSTYPSVDLRYKCLMISDRGLLCLDYSDLYDSSISFPTIDKLRDEIIWQLRCI